MIYKIPTFEKSFSSHSKAIFWNTTKNKNVIPRNVFKNSHTKFWFTCQVCDHDFNSTLNNIVRGKWCPYCSNSKLCNEKCIKCYDKSFASHQKSKFWHLTKNENLVPRDSFLGSDKKIWFTCEKCNHDFNISLDIITRENCWCSYCSNKKLCNNDDCNNCLQKSFLSHIKSKYWHTTKNNNINPRDVFKNSHSKYWFTCQECNHDFNVSLANIGKSRWCPYCSNNKLCEDNNCNNCLDKSFVSYNKSKYWHTTKNGNINPRHIFKQSNKKYWFTCQECNHEFNSRIRHVSNGTWCSMCINKTEKKLFDYLISINNKITCQVRLKKDTTKCFDFLFDTKIIIELDGEQHFQQVANWRSPIEENINDIYKNQLANECGYHMIRIYQPWVWKDTNDWKIKLHSALTYVNSCHSPSIAFIGDIFY